MKYKIPQLMCFLLAIILIVSPINTRANEITTAGQQDVSVKASIQPSFTVSLPATITLEKVGDRVSCTKQIGVKGDIEVSGSVSVTASPNFSMYDVTLRPTEITETPANEDAQSGYSHKAPIPATTTQSAVNWPYSELNRDSAGEGFSYDGDSGFHKTDLNIEVTGFSSGKWEGLVNFDINYDNGQVLAPGLYNTNGVMTKSWDDLVAAGTIHVTDGVVTTNSTGATNSSNSSLSGTLIIPSSVTSVGDYAFHGCTSLTSVTIPDSVTSIGSCAFYGCAGLTSVTIPNSVTSIANYVFFNCTCLTSATIPSSVTSIGSSVFEGCVSLTSVTIPSSVTSIGKNAFNGCTRLTSITIPDSVTTIGDCAFQRCTSLTSVTIPDSVTSIGSNAFYQVPRITYNGSATGKPWGALASN